MGSQVFLRRLNHLRYDLLQRRIKQPDAGGLFVAAPVEFLSQLQDREITLPPKVDAYDPGLALGEEHRDPHASKGSWDRDLIVDIIGHATRFGDVGVAELTVRDPAFVGNDRVVVNTAQQFKVGFSL